MINFDFHQFAKGGKLEKLENLLRPQLQLHWDDFDVFTKGENFSERHFAYELSRLPGPNQHSAELHRARGLSPPRPLEPAVSCPVLPAGPGLCAFISKMRVALLG
nr:PREDICTED: uncharacterized protein LOC103545320 isoform X1 [Equus przewalskii]